MHADGGATPTPDSGITLAEAAAVLGISKDAVRRRLRAGFLVGHRIDGPHGPTWCVHLDGVPGMRHPGAAPAPTVAHPADTVAPPAENAALVELVGRLTQENRDLAGQVGYLQARAQILDEGVRALEAPKEQPAAVSTIVEPSPPGLTHARRLVPIARALAALALMLLAAAAWVR